MNSPTTNTPKQSSHSALSIAVVLAAVLFTPRTNHAQQLQHGVSVQLAITSNAVPMPEADNEDAWIVAVTADGTLYFGIDPVSPSELADKMKARPRRRDQKLYIKADARAPFADVERVLKAGREVAFEAPVLLTAQLVPPNSGTIVPPSGLEVLVGPALPPGTVATVVQLLNSREQWPLLKVNGNEISWSALESSLRRHFQKGDEKFILLKADERLSFGPVVQVINVCRATGAQVVLDPPGL
ncbi:MAG TPA: biopolymer transporter ExbD [Candidatus Sulfotelmatobacter sp.]|nr:biopolymer transporter ExbD [Candidatus Sulfotelmatobacter sp.]